MYSSIAEAIFKAVSCINYIKRNLYTFKVCLYSLWFGAGWFYPCPSWLPHWHRGSYCPGTSEATLKNMVNVPYKSMISKQNTMKSCVFLMGYILYMNGKLHIESLWKIAWIMLMLIIYYRLCYKLCGPMRKFNRTDKMIGHQGEITISLLCTHWNT